MKKIIPFILFAYFMLLAAENTFAQNTAFPFLKPGNEWVYEGDLGGDKFLMSYKILSQGKNGYYLVQTTLVDIPTNSYWHADNSSFSFFTAWPESPLKLTLLTTNCKPGDSWKVLVPESPDSDGDDLSGSRVARIISINETVTVPGGTFEDCIRVKETFSSEPKYYLDYLVSKTRGLVKMEGISFMRYNDEPRTFFTVKYVLKGKDKPEEKPMITLSGCVNMVVGESSLLPVTFKPAGGSIRYWTEGKGITVSDGGNGANIKATEPGKAIVWAEYTTPKGAKIKESKTIYSLKVNSINSGNPLQIGLYNAKGKPTNGIKPVSVAVEPAGEVTQLSFRPADAAMVSAAPSGQNQLKVQGLKKGKTTVQAYSDCGTQTGPFLEVEVVNCDDEVVAELRQQEKMLKSRLESNLKQVAELLGNKDFTEADENGPRAIYDVNKGLRDLLLLSSVKGAGANQQALKRIVGTLSDYESLAFHAGDKNSLLFKWQAINMKLPEGPAKTISSYIKTVLELADASDKLSGYLGTMLGVSDRLEELAIQYEKTQREYLEVTRVLYKVCRRDGEPPPPEEKQKEDKTAKPSKPTTPKKPLTASGEHDIEKDEKANEVLGPPKKETEPPGENPPPPQKDPEKIKRGLLYNEENENCNCDNSKSSEIKIGEEQTISQGILNSKASMKNIKDCFDDFNKSTLAPLAKELKSIEAFFTEVEAISILKKEDQEKRIGGLKVLLDDTKGEKVEQQFLKVGEFNKTSGGCPQKLQDDIISNLKINWDRLL